MTEAGLPPPRATRCALIPWPVYAVTTQRERYPSCKLTFVPERRVVPGLTLCETTRRWCL